MSMPAIGKVDRATLRAELRPGSVLNAHAVPHKVRGDELRTKLCPACGERSRDSVCINVDSGAWKCHVCQGHGDLLALVAGYAGLDIARDFPRVIEHAAEIAGVVGADSKPCRDQHQLVEDARRRNEARTVLRHEMLSRWNRLDRRHVDGERYLASRHLHRADLLGLDVVHFAPSGDPALALRDATGELVGIQYRHVVGEPKLTCERGSKVSGSVLHGRVTDMDPDGVDVAILVEGFADTLAAHLAFPGCAIFGAPGAGQLAAIAAFIAPRLVACGGWLLIVPHVDRGVGEHAAANAVMLAEDAGLALDRSILLVDVRSHGRDLAEAWAHGWRWMWPS